MGVMGRLSFKERFRSPAALAAFGAFAVPEPFGAIMLFCAAIWWWRRRRRKVLSLAIESASARARNGPFILKYFLLEDGNLERPTEPGRRKHLA